MFTFITILLDSARSHMSSIFINESSFWISGGLGDRGSLSSTEIIHSGGSFLPATNLPEPMAYHCSARINLTHSIIAGNVYGSHREVYIVDTSRMPFQFTKLPPMLRQRWGCACTVIKTNTDKNDNCGSFCNQEELQLLVVGGDFPNYKSSELYSFSTQKWVNGPKLSRGYYYGGYVQNPYTGDLILIGGWDGSSYRKDILTYNPSEHIFETMDGGLTIARSRFGTVIVDKESFCF